LRPENPSPVESLAGLIERVTFFNEETGFAVLRVKVKGHRELVTVVGSAPSISAGEWLVAEGHWVRDKEHGLQFKASVLKSSAPTTREGIEKYLGSGMVKGIGPTYAKKLVSHFGETIFDIIDQYSARLEEVDGIGPERRRRIKAAWTEQKLVREIMVFLHSHGVSTSRAVRIYKTYGENAIETLRANPYTLAKDISGIGFKTADQIAQRVGIPRDSILRACAGLTHCLGNAMGAGHCALPKRVLITETSKLLEITESLVVEALDRLLTQGELTRETIDGEDLTFLPALRHAEQNVASKVRSLSGHAANYPVIDVEKAIAWYEQKANRTLAPTQRQALAQALANRIMIITGGPGVGKTTLLKAILTILTAKKIRAVLCAPTGRAAKRLSEATGLGAQTIHRLLEYQAAARGFARNESSPLDADLIVVDEVSMVDISLMSHLLRACPTAASLLLVGDVDQLPSIGPGSVLRDLIDCGLVPVARLTEVFRQATESSIVAAAHRINQGEMPAIATKEQTSDFYFIERNEPFEIAQTLVELVAERIPRKLGCDPIRDIQVLAPMHRGSVGVRELNAVLQDALNPQRGDEAIVEKFGSQFRIRDKVIQTENNYDKDVFNGDIGQIIRIDPLEREITIRFDHRDVIYDFAELDEVALAYAITIHKSQGSEFPAVVIPLAMQQYLLLQKNLIYTGLTRGKQFVVLVGEKQALATAVRNNKTVRRFSGLLSRLKANSPTPWQD
jgi:exodeoxyribonuclease V alpha subunit